MVANWLVRCGVLDAVATAQALNEAAEARRSSLPSPSGN